MTRRLSLVGLVVGLVVILGSPASAHPLGNFTINVHAGIVVRPDALLVDYVVDMAEIPAFQESQRIDTDGDGTTPPSEAAAYAQARCARLAGGISVELDTTPVVLGATDASVSFPPGAGDLTTLRLTCEFGAPIAVGATATIDVSDTNFAGRLGWHEMTANGDLTTIVASTVGAVSTTDRLTSYPADEPPLDERAARLRVRPGGAPLRPADGTARVGAATPLGGGVLEDLISRSALSIGSVALMIAAALGVGAAHALGPGHGKTLIGAYLAGGGHSIRQAMGVGVAVSVMHTSSVLALGLVVVSAERVVAPERVYPWLALGSGLVALMLGATLMVSRVHRITHAHGSGHDDHPHDHPDPAASHGLSRAGLLALAFSGGVLPSPSALVVLLASISLGRAALGLAMIAAFSIGLAVSLIAVGALAIRAGGMASRHVSGRLWRLTPVVSATAIAILGGMLTLRGLEQV